MYLYRSTLLFILCLLCFSHSQAQISNDTLVSNPIDTLSLATVQIDTVITRPTIWEDLKYDGITAFGAVKYTYSRPLHWKKKNYYQAGGILLGTALLLAVDEPASDFFGDQGKKMPNGLKNFGWYFGSPQNNYGITGGIYFFGLFTRNEKIRRLGVLMISSATASGIVQSISKTIAGRARPGADKGNLYFKPFANKPAYSSFPSGHAILSFTTAYSIGKQFSNPYAKYSIYAVGLITPVSRLWERQHWLSDVGLSLAMSVVVVDCIDKYLKKEKKYHYDDKNKISWNFSVGVGTIGLSGNF